MLHRSEQYDASARIDLGIGAPQCLHSRTGFVCTRSRASSAYRAESLQERVQKATPPDLRNMRAVLTTSVPQPEQ